MPSLVDPLGTSVSLGADPQGSPVGGLRLQVLPRSCPTLRSVVPRQQLSRPSPVGAALSPLQTAARVVVWLRTTMRLRLRLPASGRLSAAESGARRCCCQRLRPDAPLGLFLKRAGGVLPRVSSGEAVNVRDRIGGPGRARARSASRPNSDFGVDASLPSPDPEDPARVGPTWDLATALRRSRAGEASGGATSPPHLRPGQPFCPKTGCCAEAIQTAFSFPGHEVRDARLTYTAGPDRRATNRSGFVRGIGRSDAATVRPTTSSSGLPRRPP
jgi:hypothetical protein